MQDTEQKQKNKSSFKLSLNYGWIVKHLPFLLFLALLAIIYIANGHWADKTIRNINTTAKEVKDLEYEYKSLKSREMFKSRESQIIQAAAPLGLKTLKERPMHVIITGDSSKNLK